jgi:hypothetical protein
MDSAVKPHLLSAWKCGGESCHGDIPSISTKRFGMVRGKFQKN